MVSNACKFFCRQRRLVTTISAKMRHARKTGDRPRPKPDGHLRKRGFLRRAWSGAFASYRQWRRRLSTSMPRPPDGQAAAAELHVAREGDFDRAGGANVPLRQTLQALRRPPLHVGRDSRATLPRVRRNGLCQRLSAQVGARSSKRSGRFPGGDGKGAAPSAARV